jgi:hypothetical protein
MSYFQFEDSDSFVMIGNNAGFRNYLFREHLCNETNADLMKLL